MDTLIEYGAKLNPEWLQRNIGEDSKEILNAFLDTDIEDTSKEVLSDEIYQKPKFTMEENIIFQVNEIVDISITYAQRVNFEMNENGLLKLLLHAKGCDFIGLLDVNQLDLDVLSIPGLKICVHKGTEAFYGVFLLNKDNTKVLGGKSNQIISKREKLHIYKNDAVVIYENDLPITEVPNESKKKRKVTKSEKKTTRKKTTRSKSTTKEPDTVEIQSEKPKKSKPQLKLSKLNENDEEMDFLSNDDLQSDEIQEIEATIEASQRNEEIQSSQNLPKSDNIQKSAKNQNFTSFDKNSKIIEVNNICLVKKNGELKYSITCTLSDKKQVRLSDDLCIKAFNCLPDQFIRFPQSEMDRISNLASSSLLGVMGYVKDGFFYE
ncbi:hypothetical protein TVAG_016750 [Trichomonas vaginalis G3]|uniref:RecQ-mediated genome instability protein 1 n=1 Tax=Trichomonas vaginalis (strain ATCC PRA-98 / G3) TaxID=412133 RepID=A2ER13_TRIV3|nr:RecQ-mediated genome instability protein 1 family [Trichomonas vaginalis G3]EAY04903.1 hypothetical protein TVAG_016750 [Trichomonas vaginalis G3]KAI5519439.1 RecQ-mediated genome instability protein 1 family [Trichomonas vaginalis G3]|eukprot:XP_001317126.1 hypothetical protein [Trichomonas vaginalis G3]